MTTLLTTRDIGAIVGAKGLAACLSKLVTARSIGFESPRLLLLWQRVNFMAKVFGIIRCRSSSSCWVSQQPLYMARRY